MKPKVALIVLYDSEKKFLLQHRSRDAKLLPEYWAFFGGGVKIEETPEDAIRREAYEELNLELKAPQLVIEQDFREGDLDGQMYVYIEAISDDKSILKLQEGQGWGWYKEQEMGDLKMIERDRQIIRSISRYLENTA